MRGIASVRVSLPALVAVLCGLGLARMVACPDPVLAVDRGESIRSELRALREEVEIVRRDVRRLIELLEARVGPQDPLQPEDPLQHDEPPDAPPDSDLREDAAAVWELTLREAINIALNNSELFTLVSFGPTTDGPITIGRKDTDVGLIDAEDEAVKLVSNVEQAYWDLWLAHRNVETVRSARDDALETWRLIRAQEEALGPGGEVSARRQYFLFRGQVEEALAELYAGEKRLRRLLGLAETDGRLIRPVDEPSLREPDFDWREAHAEADDLPVLKRQRWQVRRREMEAEAAAAYLSGLERQRSQPQAVLKRQRSQPRRVEQGAEEVAVTIPLGSRKEFAGLRNAELQVAKERALLKETELAVGHQLALALRDVQRAYAAARTDHNRRLASEREIEVLTERLADREVSPDALADAQQRRTAAATDYWRSVADFAIALRDVHLKKGSLLRCHDFFFEEAAPEEPEEDDGGTSD